MFISSIFNTPWKINMEHKDCFLFKYYFLVILGEPVANFQRFLAKIIPKKNERSFRRNGNPPHSEISILQQPRGGTQSTGLKMFRSPQKSWRSKAMREKHLLCFLVVEPTHLKKNMLVKLDHFPKSRWTYKTFVNHLLDSPSFDHHFCGHLGTIWILRDSCCPLLATGGHGSKMKTHGNPWWFMVQNGGEHPKIGDRSMATILSDHWDKIGWHINTNIITIPKIGNLIYKRP